MPRSDCHRSADGDLPRRTAQYEVIVRGHATCLDVRFLRSITDDVLLESLNLTRTGEGIARKIESA